jgi:hypothetical protein
MPRVVVMLVVLPALAGCETLLDVSLGSNMRGDPQRPTDVTVEDAGATPAVPVGSGDKSPTAAVPDAGGDAPADLDAGLGEPVDAGLEDDAASGDPDGPGDIDDGDGFGGPDGFEGDGRGEPDGADDDGPRGGGD